MTAMDVVNIVAIIVGPLLAVLITRWRDNRKENIRRRSDILEALMKTRPLRLSFEHVGALNLIQMEFFGKRSVIDAYKRYRDHLSQDFPQGDGAGKRFVETRDDLFVELIHAIASDLNYKFDKKDIEKLSYGPVGWENDESAVRMIRTLAINVLTGQQPLPVSIRPPNAPGQMFPPPPP
ncbi:DUF6680 family protein [Flaviflagellibacter deserti]|uniref:DUF6680 family protein n=1 Tax=Flaviflagellibacter deserti TaxID=2267266 RepID=A0ABV9YXN3_9HYPH